MRDLTIVGGLYIERCVQPLWTALYGSAGRAAQCVSSLVNGSVQLYGYVASEIEGEAQYLASDCGVTLVPATAVHAVSFDYLHPLSTPTIRPAPARIVRNDSIQISADVVLRYGMLEGDAITTSKVAIYDPQSAFDVERFSANGSRAEKLAIVMNRSEARAMTGLDSANEAAQSLLSEGEAAVVVIKMGGHGALVATKHGNSVIPIYETDRVWKIGSGDVFSATFAALWGCHGMLPVEAADLASRATANYCNTRSLPSPKISELQALTLKPSNPGKGLVYLAAPFFDLGQRWLVEEANTLLKGLGAAVFSPVHEVGPGPARVVAPEDIKGLEEADVVFAILNGLDTGTIFEVGYAVKKGIPVVALAQNIKEEDLKMIAGTECEISDDFVSALYRTIWRLPS